MLDLFSGIQPIHQRKCNRELIVNSDIETTGITQFALSHSGHSLVDMNELTYFAEESTTTPENGSEICPYIVFFHTIGHEGGILI
jgi:hypothetical protein